MHKIKLTFSILLILALSFSVCGCGDKAAVNQTEKTNVKAQLELAHKINLGDVAEDQIPDVTKESWTFGISCSKPVVFPDGKYVLAVQSSKMTLYNAATGEKVWQKPTYGGIDTYVAAEGRLYLTEKDKMGGSKEHGYVYCLDAETGEELWRYDMQEDLDPLQEKYISKDAKVSGGCYLKVALFKDKLIAKASTGWKEGKSSTKIEAIVCLDKDGKKLWKIESHGYPGLIAHSAMKFINDKLVMGTYTYGDDKNGPTYIHAFDINTGKKLWKFDIPHNDELAYTEATDVAVAIVGDKIAGVTNYGEVYVLNKDGEKINQFAAFEPIEYNDTTICTNVWGDKVQSYGKDGLIIAPSKTVVKNATYGTKAPIEHPDAGSILVYDLGGDLRWKFRLGAETSCMKVKGNYLILATSLNRDNDDYSYTGVYAFNLAQKGEGEEVELTEESALDKYVGHYRTDGVILGNMLDTSSNNEVICAITWPTRVGTEKNGKQSLYILKLK